MQVISESTDHQANQDSRAQLTTQGDAALRFIERELHERADRGVVFHDQDAGAAHCRRGLSGGAYA